MGTSADNRYNATSPPATVYLISGRGENRGGSIAEMLISLGAAVHSRDASTLASRRFSEQLAVIRADLCSSWWHAGALLVGHSFGAYLLLHTLADLTAFPGSVVLFSPVLGAGTSVDGLYASRPPRATRLATLSGCGQFAPPRHMAVHLGSLDPGTDCRQAEAFVAGIVGATCYIVSGAGHRLPPSYIRQALKTELDRATLAGRDGPAS